MPNQRIIDGKPWPVNLGKSFASTGDPQISFGY